MAEYVKVAKTSEIADQCAKCVDVGGHTIALFNIGGEFFAIDDRCPHEEGPLSEGYVEGLRRGVARGEIRDDIEPETMSWILMAVAEFFGGRWIIDQGKPPPAYVFDDIMRFIEAGLGRPGSAV